MPMNWPQVPQVPIDEEKLLRDTENDPELREHARRLAALDARREKALAEHRMNMEGMTIERKVIRRRATVRTNRLRLNAVRRRKQEIKDEEDAKVAAEFKKELQQKLEEPQT